MEQVSGPGLPGRAELLGDLSASLAAGRRPAVVVVALRNLGELRAEDAAAADEAVAGAAGRLQRLVRSSDLLAAVDRGTFVVVGPGVGADAVQALEDRIVGAVAFPCEAGDRVLSLVADVGSATATDELDAPGLVARAEADLERRRRR